MPILIGQSIVISVIAQSINSGFRVSSDRDLFHHHDLNHFSTCGSNIGRSIGPQAITLELGCSLAPHIIHEVMHALGFWHEHTRPDRDDYVKVIWENIKEGNWDNGE